MSPRPRLIAPQPRHAYMPHRNSGYERLMPLNETYGITTSLDSDEFQRLLPRVTSNFESMLSSLPVTPDSSEASSDLGPPLIGWRAALATCVAWLRGFC